MPSIIQSLPTFVTPDQHKALVVSTPNSFSDIPTIIRHKEENVSVSFDPELPGFSPEDCTKGTLYILESVLIFMSETGKGFEVEYPHITLHAVARSASGSPSIYCQIEDPSSQMDTDKPEPLQPIQINGTLSENNGEEDDENEDDDTQDEPEEDFPSVQELKIIPQNGDSVETIFEALSRCASLHPDEPSPSDSESDDSAFIDATDNSKFETFDGNDGEELSEVGKAALKYLESIIYDPFDKARGANDTADKDDGDTAGGP